ncbi:hypothetical protein Y032_0003g1554 [Ancylostoma ceylanicum]|uniref:Uncharacterized protein n=1 Tax=Ancylostoma ceylanicum TaxID=53326 RepID=A0A016VYK0_9BILA|nr:hypothetical protein Y032_0003g1554 [Ancylostoma ceylanicum]
MSNTNMTAVGRGCLGVVVLLGVSRFPQAGVIRYAEHEYDNRFAPSIDLSTLSIFRYFYPRVGEDTSPGVIQYAEHEYGSKYFAPFYRLIDFFHSGHPKE